MRLCILLAVVAFVGLSLGEEKKEKDKELGTVIGIDLGTTYSWYVFILALPIPRDLAGIIESV